MEKKDLQRTALRILSDIGVVTNDDCLNLESIVSNQGETKGVDMHGTKVSARVTRYGDGGCRVEVHFELPEDACMAETYIEHCVKREGIPVGGWSHRPYAGRRADRPSEKHTEVYSPWNNRFFCVDSMYYGDDEFDEAVDNAITLAKPLVRHLADVPSIRFWTTEDAEVIAKAKEIVAGADLHETDCDREEQSHWLADRNSFFKGWFFPFRDNGRGTFDILWPSSIERAAIGIEGSFEYAVSCILLQDPEYIRKARMACVIRKETRTYIY